MSWLYNYKRYIKLVEIVFLLLTSTIEIHFVSLCMRFIFVKTPTEDSEKLQ